MENEVWGKILECPRCHKHWLRVNALSDTTVCRKCGLKASSSSFEIKRLFDPAKPPKGVLLSVESTGGLQLGLGGEHGNEKLPTKE